MKYPSLPHWTHEAGAGTVGPVSVVSGTDQQGHQPGTREYRRVVVALFAAGIATFTLLYSTQAVLPALAERFGEVDVLLEYSTTQKCDRRCREAEGDDCECSCLGEHHAGGMYMHGWIEVGETTLIQPGRQLRHMRVVRR